MWPFIIGFILVVGIIVVVMNRRGSTGAGKDWDEHPRTHGDDRAASGEGYGNGGF